MEVKVAKQQHVTSPLKDSGPDNVGLAGANARQSVSTMLLLLDLVCTAMFTVCCSDIRNASRRETGFMVPTSFLQSLYAYAVVRKVS